MKVLKIVERIVFLVAVVVAAAALSLSVLMDESAEQQLVGIATSVLGNGAFLFGTGLLLIFLLVGAFLRENKGPVASKVGEGFVLAAILSMFGAAAPVLFFNEYAGLTVILAFVAAILYAVDGIVRFIIFIVKIVKPQAGQENPDDDARIQNVLKWKKLADDGIITKEEFEEKRVKLLGLDKE